MTQPMAQPRPFAFDTEFGPSGEVVRMTPYQPVRRAYTPVEVEALIADARLEARDAALAEVESLKSMALIEIAQSIASALPTLAHHCQVHRQQAAELAVAAGRIMAAGALERCPQAPVEAALQALGQEIDASPRLVIHAGGLDDAACEQLRRMAVDAGFSGAIAFRDVQGPSAAFALEWADGRAAFDPDEAAARVQAAVTAALAADAGHAEPISQGAV